MKKQTITKYIESYIGYFPKGNNLAEDLSNVLEQEKNIKYSIDKLNKEDQDNEKNFKQTRESIKKRLFEVQQNCSHLETTYFGDAAGGSDSSTVCDWCGKEI